MAFCRWLCLYVVFIFLQFLFIWYDKAKLEKKRHRLKALGDFFAFSLVFVIFAFWSEAWSHNFIPTIYYGSIHQFGKWRVSKNPQQRICGQVWTDSCCQQNAIHRAVFQLCHPLPPLWQVYGGEDAMCLLWPFVWLSQSVCWFGNSWSSFIWTSFEQISRHLPLEKVNSISPLYCTQARLCSVVSALKGQRSIWLIYMGIFSSVVHIFL